MTNARDLVDEEAFKIAFDDRDFSRLARAALFANIGSYERAKLDKLTGKTDSAKPSQGVGGHDDTLSGAGVCQPMPIKQELPPLPEKLFQAGSLTKVVRVKGYMVATLEEYQKLGNSINQLIDCIAALYKRGE